MRITIDIDDPILKELKRLQVREGKALGRLVSDLLAESLSMRRHGRPQRPAFRWVAKPMGARVDLSDRDAVLDAMDAARSDCASQLTSTSFFTHRTVGAHCMSAHPHS